MIDGWMSEGIVFELYEYLAYCQLKFFFDPNVKLIDGTRFLWIESFILLLIQAYSLISLSFTSLFFFSNNFGTKKFQIHSINCLADKINEAPN